MNTICAIIVSYNPAPSLVDSIDALLQQVDSVVIVDNASDTACQKTLRQATSKPGVELIRHITNLGIAAALNTGIRYAQQKKYLWIATFDQDSRVTPGYMENMLAAYEDDPDHERIALIAPVYHNEQAAFYYDQTTVTTAAFTEIETAMTSGNLVNLSIFKTVGLFREDFFIDYVDHEFCLRCRNHGLKLIQATGALLEHNLGRLSRHTFLGKNPVVSNHSPLRRYYVARNRIVIYTTFFATHPKWVLRDLRNFLSELIKIILIEEDAPRKIRATLIGVSHGIFRKLGSCTGTM
jgi:rhamnosyltransferase